MAEVNSFYSTTMTVMNNTENTVKNNDENQTAAKDDSKTIEMRKNSDDTENNKTISDSSDRKGKTDHVTWKHEDMAKGI